MCFICISFDPQLHNVAAVLVDSLETYRVDWSSAAGEVEAGEIEERGAGQLSSWELGSCEFES